MLPIAGPTAGPNVLIFFVDTHGWPGVVIDEKIQYFFSIFLNKFFFQIYFFHGQRLAFQLVFYNCKNEILVM